MLYSSKIEKLDWRDDMVSGQLLLKALDLKKRFIFKLVTGHWEKRKADKKCTVKYKVQCNVHCINPSALPGTVGPGNAA